MNNKYFIFFCLFHGERAQPVTTSWPHCLQLALPLSRMQLSWQARVAQSVHIDAQVCWLPLAATAVDVPHACRHSTTNKSRSGLVTNVPQLKM